MNERAKAETALLNQLGTGCRKAVFHINEAFNKIDKDANGDMPISVVCLIYDDKEGYILVRSNSPDEVTKEILKSASQDIIGQPAIALPIMSRN